MDLIIGLYDAIIDFIFVICITVLFFDFCYIMGPTIILILIYSYDIDYGIDRLCDLIDSMSVTSPQ